MANNIIDKIQISGQSYDVKDSSAATVVELTQQEYNDLPSSAKTGNTLFVITDAQAVDLTNYYTKSETNTLLGGKQATLVSGTNIKTINNESILGSGNIDIQGGGGKAIEAGRGISITTGATADTVSFDLPIYKTVSGTAHSLVLNTSLEPSASVFKTKYNTYINCINPYVDNNSGSKNLIMGEACSAMSYASDSFVGGLNSKIGDSRTFAFGSRSEALAMGAVAFGYDGHSFKPQVSKGQGSFACGGGTSANTKFSFATGYHTFTTSRSEFASGQYNNSVSATTTFGDSGNTLFSVGNGTADNARHNAFEIRQNGDIYLTKDGQDVKLQDQLGGGGTVDQTIISGSTNAVAGGAVYNKFDEVEEVTAAALNELNEAVSGKQDTLVSGTNIKTINNESILGSGNIDIQGGSTYTAGRGIDITNDTISFSLPISAGTGSNSIVEGQGTTASGDFSHAEGSYTTANGNSSHAEGYGTTANAHYSHAEGQGTTASGNYSHAEGQSTKANGQHSHAEGYSTTASGNSSHAEGKSTSAMTDYSHAEGENSVASGSSSHAEGKNTTASGIYSHAEGINTKANGSVSHAEGNNATASGLTSHAEGSSTKANGNYSHAEGQGTIANNQSEHASGQYNVSSKANTTWGDSGNTLFSVGNGTSAKARHNAFEIRQNGDIYLSSGGTDIKLQDHLGGGTVDQTIISGSTNAVAGGAVYDQLGGLKLVKLTQAEYNALATKDSSTLYIIVN